MSCISVVDVDGVAYANQYHDAKSALQVRLMARLRIGATRIVTPRADNRLRANVSSKTTERSGYTSHAPARTARAA